MEHHLLEGTGDTAAAELPCTETERCLLEIWAAVLGHDDLNVHEHFIALGGDSLAAMRCANQVRARFELDLPLDAFFMAPASIAELAARLDGMRCDPGFRERTEEE